MADIEKFIYYSNGSKKVLKPTDRIVIGSGGLAFEGATANDFETEFTVTDPTADRSIEFPDEDGEVALLQGDALPKALSFPVKNPSTTTALTKGQIVYISGHSGNKPEVSLARSNSSSTMPAFGFVQSDIAAEAEGYVVYSGLFKGIDTNTSYSEGDTLYVSDTTAGAFVNAPPTGSNLIQNIGKIIKSDDNNGELLVGGAGRTNATPNLDQGKFFIGNASNQSTQSAYTLPITDGTANQVLTTNGSGAVSFSDVSITPAGSDTQLQYNNSGALGASSNLTWDNSGGADSNGLLTSQNITVSNRLSLGGSGSQFFAFNEDTVKVKFANWYSSNTRQYGQGQLWYEQWFGAIDDQAGASNRRIGFYLELPDKGASDAAGGTSAHPENARMWVDTSSIGMHYDNPLRFYEDGTGEKHGTNYIQVQGQSSLTSNSTITLPPNATGIAVVRSDTTPTSNDLLVYDSTNFRFEPTGSLDPIVVGLPSNPSTPFSGIKMLQVTNPFGSSVVSTYADYTDSIITELSIPGVDLQTDTNAFRFNCPYGLIVTGLDLYLDQHTTSGDVTVTVTNTTDSASMISLSVSGTNTSATTTTVTNATCDSGDIITFAITATPANAQGLRANLHFTRT